MTTEDSFFPYLKYFENMEVLENVTFECDFADTPLTNTPTETCAHTGHWYSKTMLLSVVWLMCGCAWKNEMFPTLNISYLWLQTLFGNPLAICPYNFLFYVRFVFRKKSNLEVKSSLIWISAQYSCRAC